MKQRKAIIVWFSFVALVMTVVPVTNLIIKGPEDQVRYSLSNLLSTDRLESQLNQALYVRGLSGSPEQVVVGKEGWLFLGNYHDHVIDKSRGRNEIILKHVVDRAQNIQTNINWIQEQGIQTVFAIIPNKHRVYPEYLPDWLNTGRDRYLEVVLGIANASAETLLLLKPAMLAEKSSDQLLYYPLDSHWNGKGAWIGYRQIMQALNAKSDNGFEIFVPDFEEQLNSEADLAGLLKLAQGGLLPDSGGLRFAQTQLNASLCRHSLTAVMLETIGSCINSNNTPTDVVSGPVYTFNSEAVNQARVLWLRDSFGNGNSQLFQATFKELWQVHHSDLFGAQLREFITRENPDVVIYQVIERLMDASYLGRELL